MGRGMAAIAVVGALAAAPAAAHAQDEPFRDPRLPMSERIDDLMQRLTLDEKIGLLHQYQPAIPRLGIGVFKAGTEALHGVAWSNDYYNKGTVVTATATTFPQAVGLASTWDTALMKQVGSVVGDEARGMHATNSTVWGLNLWAPVVNLLRDPRWGRNEEGYSEDPTLTSAMAIAYGSGAQGDHPTYLKTAPTLKHLIAYNNEVDRSTTSSNVPPRVLHEYDEMAFKPAIEANAATGIMASYNLLNGRPTTVDPLNEEVRTWTDRTLFNVSDAFAPYNLTGSQRYFASQAEANAAMFKSGLDSFTADDNNPAKMIASVKEALDRGLLTVADIERANRHALSIRFRLGEFDPDGGPYGSITAAEVNAPDHQQLARKAAGEAAVLLKNDDRALPLDAAKTKRVAVVGPLADTIYTDWYGGKPPYAITPREGIAERLGDGATVTGGEAVDRIALKHVETGRYVTSTGTTDADAVAATATDAGASAQFDVFDWGQGVVTLRNVATEKVLGYNWGPFITRDDQPTGWFVQQQFKLEEQADGTFVIHYVGYETREGWFGANTYVTVGDDGKLGLGAAAPAEAARFARTTIRSGVESAVAAAREADTAIVVVGSMPFINGRENNDRTTMALAEGQARLVREVTRANPNTVMVLQTSYPDTITWEQEHVPAILWTTHAGQETGSALADILFGDRNPSGRLPQTWYRSDADLPSILEYDIIAADRTYLYFKGRPLYPFGHGLSYTSFRYSHLRTSARSVAADGTVDVTVRVTNTGPRAGAEVVQLYTRQRESRNKQPLRQLRAFERVELIPGEARDVRLRLPVADLAHWDVTREREVVEASRYDLLVGASSADIRERASIRVRGERIPPRDLSTETRAENFDRYAGVQLVDESKVRGTAIEARTDGDWAQYADARLRRPSTFTARVAKESPGAGRIEVRLDSPRGPLLGSAQFAATGDRYRYAPVTAELARPAGRRDVYLVLSGGVRLASFRLR